MNFKKMFDNNEISEKEYRICGILSKNGQASRYLLRKELDLNTPYVHKYLSNLMEMGLVIESLPGIYTLAGTSKANS